MPSPPGLSDVRATEQHRGLVVGVISDTHNHLCAEVKELLDGVDHIIHAGDVCSPTVLSELRGIAPLTVVRGNCDAGAWADTLPARAEFELGGVRVVMGHIGGRLREEAASRGSGPGGFDVVVFGHSHQPVVERKDGVLYLNPGSAGPRRYGRPRTMAFLRIAPEEGSGAAADRVVANIVMVEG
jgi:uncharacterized protein